ncbi:MAG: hypothetical protein ACRC80_08485 [Waterburya sp.]
MLYAYGSYAQALNSFDLTSFNFPFSTIQVTMQRAEKITQIINNYGSIKVVNNKIILSDRLQEELQAKIITARDELQTLEKLLAINSSETIGIGYFHLGQNNWELKFTFGGIILDTSETIVLSTKQVFALKKFFQNTELLEINGQKYQTTRSMIQFGPILHERDFK